MIIMLMMFSPRGKSLTYIALIESQMSNPSSTKQIGNYKFGHFAGNLNMTGMSNNGKIINYF